eukprot:3432792-Prymnesium_polylepis.2
MHDAGSVGPIFATWHHAQGCRGFSHSARTIGQKEQKRTSPTRTTGSGGGAGPPQSSLHLLTSRRLYGSHSHASAGVRCFVTPHTASNDKTPNTPSGVIAGKKRNVYV